MEKIIVFIKRILLLFYGPVIFAFVMLCPIFCGRKKGFRRWYWCLIRRTIRWLMNALSIEIVISESCRKKLLEDTGSLIVANHKSHLDVLALIAAIPDEKWITFGAKKEITKVPFLGRGLLAAGVFIIDRKNGRAGLNNLTEAYSLAPKRLSLILFPEGTRVPGKELGPFKAGAVKIAREANRTILPICIWGAGDLMPKGRIIPRHGQIHLKVMDAYRTNDALSINDNREALQCSMAHSYSAENG